MKNSNLLGEEKVSKLLIKFSVPAVVGMLVNAMYNLVDRIFIGNAVGSLGIAGTTISFPIMLMTISFIMLIGIGATSLISIRLGEQKKEEAELIMGNAMVLLIVLSVLLSGIGLLFINPLLNYFGASANALPYAREYLRVILWGTVFQSIGFGMNSFIRAEGNPKIAMLTMLLGAVLNTILDPIFLFIFDLGVAGAAYATILSQAISAAWVLYYFLGGKSTLKLRSKNLKLHLPTVGRIIALGASPFAMQLATSVLNIIMNKNLSIYGGDVAVSGMGVVMSIITLIIMPVFGINQGVQPIIGYNYGAKKFDRVREALKLGILAGTTIVCLGFLVTMLIPRELVAIFNRQDRDLINFGSHALRITLIFLPIVGFQIVSASYFQATGKPKQAALLSLSRQVLIMIPALLILPKFFALNGVLMAAPLADLLSSVITGTFLLRELKHLDDGAESTEPCNA